MNASKVKYEVDGWHDFIEPFSTDDSYFLRCTNKRWQSWVSNKRDYFKKYEYTCRQNENKV